VGPELASLVKKNYPSTTVKHLVVSPEGILPKAGLSSFSGLTLSLPGLTSS
jgi:hypothetical protein